MDITKLNKNIVCLQNHLNYSFVIKIQQLPHIWLINCYETCQHLLIQKRIKISQISKIFITELNNENINGLLGLLSSLSLSTRISKLDIYGPEGLYQYICYLKKYSKTNFHYNLQIHHTYVQIISSNNLYTIYTSTSNNIFLNYNVISREKEGKFNLQNAIDYNIPNVPLYGNLKNGHDFILHDGYFIYGIKYINKYTIGKKIVLMHNYCVRLNNSISKETKIILL